MSLDTTLDRALEDHVVLLTGARGAHRSTPVLAAIR